MNIVIIDKYDSARMSGTLMFTSRLMDFLKRQGHTVTTLRFSNEKKLPKDIFPIPFHVAEPRTYIIVPSEKTHTIIVRHLKMLKPDIVYAYCGVSPFDFLLPTLCHRLRIPLAVVWHQDFNYSSNPFQLIAKTLFWAYVPVCDGADLLHVFSEKLKKFYVRRGIRSGKIIVLPNGVNPKQYKPGKSVFAVKHVIQTGILFMGRLTLVKNPEVLLQSFLSLNPPLSTKLVIVGRGDLEHKLKRQYTDPRIIFTGLISDEKKKLDIMRSCQIFVQPSVNEGMSLALLESMATGLASITSDAGNNKQLLMNAGTIIPFDRLKKDLPVILSTYLNDPDMVHAQGNQARKTIIKHHIEDSIYSKLVTSLTETAANYKRKHA